MILHSGGAKGSDTVFATLSLQNGLYVVIHSFEGHKINMPYLKESSLLRIKKHTKEELGIIYSEYIVKVAKYMGRNAARLEYTKDLLARDYFQINETEAVFAVGVIDSVNNGKVIVAGGTGYAISMALRLNIPYIIIYDQQDMRWYNIKNGKLQKQWNEPIVKMKDFAFVAGIGTRNLNQFGLKAIQSLF